MPDLPSRLGGANDRNFPRKESIDGLQEPGDAKIACLEKIHFSPVFTGNVNFPAEINMEFKGRKLFL